MSGIASKSRFANRWPRGAGYSGQVLGSLSWWSCVLITVFIYTILLNRDRYLGSSQLCDDTHLGNTVTSERQHHLSNIEKTL